MHVVLFLPCSGNTITCHVSHFYRPQRSCEGYVFTDVCLSTGGCLVRGCLLQGMSAPGGCLIWGGLGQRGCLVPGGLLRGSWSGRVSGSGGCLVWVVPGPGGLVSQHALRQIPPPPRERRLLLPTVRILLECILVDGYVNVTCEWAFTLNFIFLTDTTVTLVRGS